MQTYYAIRGLKDNTTYKVRTILRTLVIDNKIP